MNTAEKQNRIGVLDLSADLLGVLFSMFAWFLLTWGPIIVIIAFVYAAQVGQRPLSMSLLAISIAIAATVMVSIGFILRWVSKGLLYRRKGRVVLAALFLLVYGFIPLVSLAAPNFSPNLIPQIVLQAIISTTLAVMLFILVFSGETKEHTT